MFYNINDDASRCFASHQHISSCLMCSLPKFYRSKASATYSPDAHRQEYTIALQQHVPPAETETRESTIKPRINVFRVLQYGFVLCRHGKGVGECGGICVGGVGALTRWRPLTLQEISASSMRMDHRATCPVCVVNSIFILLVCLVTHCCYVAAILEVCVRVCVLPY